MKSCIMRLMLPVLPTKNSWNKFNARKNPFLSFEFMNSLEQSGSIGEDAGWLPLHFKLSDESFLYTFIKSHSYGEFIFDWGWAEAYERHSIPYYPKLTSMIPFTPVSTSHFLVEGNLLTKKDELLKQHDDFMKGTNLSSAHFLYIHQSERELFHENGYSLREGLQYHFTNQDFKNFDDFLGHLKPKKAKTIRNERIFPDLTIKQFTGRDLTPLEASRMFDYYCLTIENKNSYAYLKKDFFKLVFEHLSDQVLFIEAYEGSEPIAGSLFFFDEEKLYGRYWGSKKYVHNLHFELCYYQGIDFCIERNLKIFEAGAQGEHKIARGFSPTLIHSAHKLQNPSFHAAVNEFIQNEKIHVHKNKESLSLLLPFKK